MTPGPDAGEQDLAREIVREATSVLHADEASAVAAVLALLRGRRESGWVEVSDDPATWPADTNDDVLTEYRTPDGSGVERGSFQSGAVRTQLGMMGSRSRLLRWMPWPSRPRAGGE